MENKLTHYRLDYTDVILQDYEDGKGKIIISNDDRDINLSYYWGCMGEGYDLSKFILKTNDEYLVRKLGVRDNSGDFNSKKTMKNIRSYIKNDSSWRWYMNLEADKNLRKSLNEVEKYSYDDRHFVDLMQNLDVDFPSDVKHHKYKYEWDEMIQAITIEPWYFIVKDEHKTNVWLYNFLPKLRAIIGGNNA